jgi:hypothetical protein
MNVSPYFEREGLDVYLVEENSRCVFSRLDAAAEQREYNLLVGQENFVEIEFYTGEVVEMLPVYDAGTGQQLGMAYGDRDRPYITLKVTSLSPGEILLRVGSKNEQSRDNEVKINAVSQLPE